MRLVEFSDATRGGSVWVNPANVQTVSANGSTGAMLVMRDTVILVKETVTSVVYRLSCSNES